MPDVAALQVTIGADTHGLEQGIARANQQVSGFGSQLGGLASAVTTAFAAVGAGAAAGIGAAVKTAMDFEKQMSAVGAVAGATEQEMADLTKTALQLGKDTSYSAKEAAAGMEELVKAGVSMADIMNGAGRAALDLAAAGGVEVATAAEIASNAMNTFNKTGEEMTGVVNTIAGAANASAIGVNDFKFSLAAVGAVAATVGLSFDDTATAIALMGQAGIKGSDAGTSLKTMLMNLQPVTNKQNDAFRELGLITADGSNRFFDAAGNVKSLAEISQVLQDALKGQTKQQQLATLEMIFGSDAIRAGAVLMEAGAAGANKMAEAMRAQGDAQRIANERLNNLAGSLEKFWGSVETGAIILGGLFTPVLKSWVDDLTVGVNTAIEIIEQLPDAWRTAGQAFAGAWEPSATLTPFMNAVGNAAIMVRDTFGPAIQTATTFLTALWDAIQANVAPIAAFVAGFTGALATIGLVTAVVTAFAAVLGFLLSPLGLVAVAVGALAVAWQTNFMGIQETTAAFWAWLQPILMEWIDWLGPKIQAVLTWLTTTGWPMMLEAGRAVADWITTVAIPAITDLIAWLGPKVQEVVNWITQTGWPAVVKAGQAISEWITQTAIPALTDLIAWLGPKIQEVTTWITDTGWPALVTAGEKVWQVVQEITRFFQDLYVELDKRGTFEELGRIWNTLVDIGGRVWDILQKIGTAVGGIMAATVLPALNTAMAVLGKNAELAGPPVGVVAGAIDSMAKAASGALGLLDKMLGTLQKISEIKITLPSFSLPGLTTTGLQTMSYTGSPDTGSKLTRAYQIAREMGYTEDQANAMLGTLRAEGGMTGIVGDSGTSFGPFQLHTPGQFENFQRWLQQQGITGNAQQHAHDIELATRFAMETYYGAALRAGTAAGLTGPALATYAQRYGQVSITPERAGAAYGPPPGMAVNAPMTRIPLGAAVPGAPLEAGPLPPFMSETFEALPEYLQSLDTIQQLGEQTYTQVATVAREQGLQLMGSQSDAVGNVLSVYRASGGEIVQTTVDATGQVLSQYVTLADGTVQNMSGMAEGVTVSQQQLGANLLTTATTAAGQYVGTITTMSGQIVAQYLGMSGQVIATTAAQNAGVIQQYNVLGTAVSTSVQATMTGVNTTLTDAAGNMVTTVTTSNGEILAQYATLANGATLSMQDMAVKTTTSVNEAAGTITTTVTDLAGNVIATTTDMGGNVVAQTVTTATQVTQQWATMSERTKQTIAEMGNTVIGQSRQMGDGLVTATRNAAGEMVSVITNAKGEVVGTFKEIVEAGKTVATGFDAAAKGLQKYADSIKQVGKAARSAADDLEEFNRQAGGSRSAKEFAKRQHGGPVSAMVPYIVGESGPELFIPYGSGEVVPAGRFGMAGVGGGGVTVIVNVNGALLSDDRMIEEAVVRGLDSARRRGRET